MNIVPYTRMQMAWRPTKNANQQMVVGIIDAPAGVFQQDSMALFLAVKSLRDGDLQLMPERRDPKEVNEYALEHLDNDKLGNAVTHAIFAKRAVMLPVIMEVLLRDTMAPASAGRAITAFAGVIQASRDALPQQETLLRYEGGPDGNMQFTRNPGGLIYNDLISEEGRGSTLDHLLELPIWGFDSKPWGLYSTLKPDLQRELHTIRPLNVRRNILGQTLPDGDEEIYQRLNSGPARTLGGSGHVARDDKLFQKFLVANYEAGEFDGEAPTVVTEDQIRWRATHAGRILQDVMRSVEDEIETPAM